MIVQYIAIQGQHWMKICRSSHCQVGQQAAAVSDLVNAEQLTDLASLHTHVKSTNGLCDDKYGGKTAEAVTFAGDISLLADLSI